MFDTGAQLRKVRKKSNLTLDQLAGLSGIDRGTISRIELGHVSPRIDTIDCLCQAMNTTLPQFFGHEGVRPLALDGVQAGPVAGILDPLVEAKVDTDAYWPVPTAVWQSLVDVVERFEALLSNSGELVLVLDRNGKIMYLSPGGETLLGFKRTELMGTLAVDLVHSEDRPRFATAFSGSGPGAAAAREYRLRHKHGTWSRFTCTLTDHLHSPSIRAVILNAALAD
jgi:PAS domain S-box-containing protein